MKGIIFEEKFYESFLDFAHEEPSFAKRLLVPDAKLCISVKDGCTTAFSINEPKMREALTKNRSSTSVVEVPEVVVKSAQAYIEAKEAFDGTVIPYWEFCPELCKTK